MDCNHFFMCLSPWLTCRWTLAHLYTSSVWHILDPQKTQAKWADLEDLRSRYKSPKCSTVFSQPVFSLRRYSQTCVLLWIKETYWHAFGLLTLLFIEEVIQVRIKILPNWVWKKVIFKPQALQYLNLHTTCVFQTVVFYWLGRETFLVKKMDSP